MEVRLDMDDSKSPGMSVVIVTPDHYETIRMTLQYLKAQTIREQLELIIVAPSGNKLKIDEQELKGFFQFRMIEVSEMKSIAWANGMGLRQATAPVVAFIEAHAFPDPLWAETLLKAHRKDYVAVGPVVLNANPHSLISWADYLIAYGKWSGFVHGQEIDFLPGHNSSYKRFVLLNYSQELEKMLEAETILHWDLRKKGYRLYLEPKAKIYHVNISRLSSYMKTQYFSGCLFASSRAVRWKPIQRWLFVAGSFLIPCVRLWRILFQIHPSVNGVSLLLPRVFLPLLAGLMMDGMGQMMGYAFGEKTVGEKFSQYEFHRLQHITERDKKHLLRSDLLNRFKASNGN